MTFGKTASVPARALLWKIDDALPLIIDSWDARVFLVNTVLSHATAPFSMVWKIINCHCFPQIILHLLRTDKKLQKKKWVRWGPSTSSTSPPHSPAPLEKIKNNSFFPGKRHPRLREGKKNEFRGQGWSFTFFLLLFLLFFLSLLLLFSQL